MVVPGASALSNSTIPATLPTVALAGDAAETQRNKRADRRAASTKRNACCAQGEEKECTGQDVTEISASSLNEKYVAKRADGQCLIGARHRITNSQSCIQCLGGRAVVTLDCTPGTFETPAGISPSLLSAAGIVRQV